MSPSRPIIYSLFAVFAALSVSGGLAQELNSPISVKIVQDGRLSEKGLILHWTVVNHSTRPAVIYSTFLYGPAAGHRISMPGEAELFTSLMEHSDVDLNAYPKATFIRLRPGESVEGDFKDSLILDRWASPGMKLCLDVAYGADDDAVKRAIADQARNPHGGHPANPIVDWQRISKSGQIVLR